VSSVHDRNWDGGNSFHLDQLTKAQCKDDPAIPSPAPPAANFDTFIGTGNGRLNGVSGATATWTFTDAGEPGVNGPVDYQGQKQQGGAGNPRAH